jgi:hypothetical protein
VFPIEQLDGSTLRARQHDTIRPLFLGLLRSWRYVLPRSGRTRRPPDFTVEIGGAHLSVGLRASEPDSPRDGVMHEQDSLTV